MFNGIDDKLPNAAVKPVLKSSHSLRGLVWVISFVKTASMARTQLGCHIELSVALL